MENIFVITIVIVASIASIIVCYWAYKIIFLKIIPEINLNKKLLKQIEINEAVLNFAYFTANFPSDFIEKAWNDEPHLAQHLHEKILGYAKDEGFISAGTFMKWFFDLDAENKEILINWIQNNYKY